MLIAVGQSVKSVTVKPVTRSSRSAQRRASTSSPDPGVTTETSGKSCAKKRESFANTHTDHTLRCSLFGVVNLLLIIFMLIAVGQSVKSVMVKPVIRSSRSAQRRASSSSPDPCGITETSGKSCANKRESFANTHTHYGVFYLGTTTRAAHAELIIGPRFRIQFNTCAYTPTIQETVLNRATRAKLTQVSLPRVS